MQFTKIYFFILALSAALTSGCIKTKTDDVKVESSPTIDTAVKQLEATCLDQIKERILKADIPFEKTRSAIIRVTYKSRQPLNIQAAKDKYSLSKKPKTGSVVSMGVEYNQSLDVDSTYSYDLTAPTDEDSNFLYTLTSSYSETSTTLAINIAQSFNVDPNCQLQLSTTKLASTEFKEKEVAISYEEEHADNRPGSSSSFEKTVPIPTDGVLIRNDVKLNSIVEMKNFLALYPNGTQFYLPSTQAPYFLKAKIELSDKTSVVFDPILKKDSVLEILNIQFDQIGVLKLLASDETIFSISQFNDQNENWTVDKNIFKDTILSKNQSIFKQTFEMADLFAKAYKPVIAEFLTSKEFSYPNFESYWQIQSKEKFENSKEGFTYKYTLLSQDITAVDQPSAALVNDADEIKSNPYLQETKNLQISIASVQAIVTALKKTGITDRLAMARVIGSYVTSTITYDYRSLQTNAIYALNTADVLARKTGVCQHFANLYATLARGVGLPARIITGFHLSNGNVVAHAWNEIEIRPGVWMPIEPQHADLRLVPYSYLPIVAGGYLETMDSMDAFNEGLKMRINFQGKVLSN